MFEAISLPQNMIGNPHLWTRLTQELQDTNLTEAERELATVQTRPQKATLYFLKI